MDLLALGRLLEKRRDEIGMTRAELARRIEKTPNYLWMVERGRPRDDGEPSQPSKELLECWIVELRWDAEHRRQVMELAGHPDPVLDSDSADSPTGTIVTTIEGGEQGSAGDAKEDSPNVATSSVPVPARRQSLSSVGMGAYGSGLSIEATASPEEVLVEMLEEARNLAKEAKALSERADAFASRLEELRAKRLTSMSDQ